MSRFLDVFYYYLVASKNHNRDTMNLGDPQLELIDPTPNIHSLFLHFDDIFFHTKLKSRVIVKWSKRMYSCAGVCTYEGSGGLCTISLSEPLLKLRPRKDLVETLLHEMIHAYLFVAVRDRDRDGHGPNFQAHMHRINQLAGINITIYHDFHDEVQLYQTHWWRCNGPCQKQRPHFGIVRRSVNTAPSPKDYWFSKHMRQCGGTFIKIKEPEKKNTKTIKGKVNSVKPAVTKKLPVNGQIPKPVLKDSNNIPVKTATKPNGALFTDKGRNRTKSADVTETVRNVWANKQLPNLPKLGTQAAAKRKTSITPETNTVNKHKTQTVHSPPTKVRKIDDYFKTAATVLKDIYGQDFNVTQSKDKLVATVAAPSDLVDCPVCSTKVCTTEVNRHIDECLNKDIIETLRKDTEINLPNTVLDVKVKTEPSISKVKTEPGIKVKVEPGNTQVKIEPGFSHMKIEPGISKDVGSTRNGNFCACCGETVDKPMKDHLDECIAFFVNDTTIPEEGASTSFGNQTIVIDDDDDVLDESITMNATGTKVPCPCCLTMTEELTMNVHLDQCLS